MRLFSEIAALIVTLGLAAGAVKLWVVEPIRWIDRKLDELNANNVAVIELRDDVEGLSQWELDHKAIHRRLVAALKGAGIDYDERNTLQ